MSLLAVSNQHPSQCNQVPNTAAVAVLMRFQCCGRSNLNLLQQPNYTDMHSQPSSLSLRTKDQCSAHRSSSSCADCNTTAAPAALPLPAALSLRISSAAFASSALAPLPASPQGLHFLQQRPQQQRQPQRQHHSVIVPRWHPSHLGVTPSPGAARAAAAAVAVARHRCSLLKAH